MTPTPLSSGCKGRAMLVTGGASGLGESIVTFYAHASARVVIADRNQSLGVALEQRLAAEGCAVKYVSVDVADLNSQIAMLRESLAWFGAPLDALVACAGVHGNAFDLTPAPPSALDDAEGLVSLQRNATTLQVNLTSVVLLVQLAVKYAMGLTSPDDGKVTPMGSKSVTLIGSLAGYRALPRAVDYSAAKWGVRGAFRSLRQQLPRLGVRVNLVAPAFVKTPLLEDAVPRYEAMGVRFASREDVVAAVRRVIEDEGCHGQACAVSVEGVTEMSDDVDDRDGFDVVEGLVRRGALGSASSPIGYDGPKGA